MKWNNTENGVPDEDITPSRISQGEEEEDQHGRQPRLHHDGGPVQLKLESISSSTSSPG
jgi:hypothetical protein